MTPKQRLPFTTARRQLTGLVDGALHRGERVVIQRHGKDAAAIVSTEDLELLEILEDELEERWAQAALRRARKLGGRTPLEDYLRQRGA